MKSLTLWRSLAAVLAALAAFLAWQLWKKDTAAGSSGQQPRPLPVASPEVPPEHAPVITRAAAGSPNGENPGPSQAGHIQLSHENARRLFEEHGNPMKGTFPGTLTWDSDVLALLAISPEANAKLDDALRNFSAERLQIIKSLVKQLPSNDRVQNYSIPDWSAQGEGLYRALKAAIVEAVGTSQAELILKKMTYSGHEGNSMMGKDERLVSFSDRGNGAWKVENRIGVQQRGTDEVRFSAYSHTSTHYEKLPDGWMEIFKVMETPETPAE